MKNLFKNLFKIIWCIFGLFVLLFSIIVFRPLFYEGMVTKQVNKEYLTLNNELSPLLVYLKEYKKIKGVYPDDVKNVFVLYSKTFNDFEYTVAKDKKGYSLKVYPTRGIFSYYYNDERDNGYNYYVKSGYYDGFLDNEYFFEIDKTWHGVIIEFL